MSHWEQRPSSAYAWGKEKINKEMKNLYCYQEIVMKFSLESYVTYKQSTTATC